VPPEDSVTTEALPPPTEVGGGRGVEACRLDKEFTMKPMKLADVRKRTGRELTYAEAVKLANPGDPFLRNMAVALSLHSWNNTVRGLAASRSRARDHPSQTAEELPVSTPELNPDVAARTRWPASSPQRRPPIR
jgi:hypothetical protein